MNRHQLFPGTRRGRLYRNPRDGIILGFCSGIADHLGLGAWTIRGLAVIMLMLFTWKAALAYLAFGIFIPERAEGREWS
jgi:phage shock protein PspC (stress-responsive transcriptional regulator)